MSDLDPCFDPATEPSNDEPGESTAERQIAAGRRLRDRRIAGGLALLVAVSATIQRQRQAQATSSATFRSVRDALKWWCEARGRLRGAQSMSPRAETIPGTSDRTVVRVDGGRGGDLDAALATLATIERAVEDLADAVADPRCAVRPASWPWLVEARWCGWSGVRPEGSVTGPDGVEVRPEAGTPWPVEACAARLRVDESSVYRAIERIEAELARVLVAGEVVQATGGAA